MFAGEGWSIWQVWILYFFIGGITLGMLYYPIRKLSSWLQLFLLAPVAAMMFAPLAINPGSSSWAPALLVMIFEVEKNGTGSFSRGLFPLVLLWLAILALGSAWLIKKKQRSNSTTKTETPAT